MASKEQVFEEAWKKFGPPSQLKLLAEECCELAVVVLKQGRAVNGAGLDQLAEEMADVELCLDQVRYALKLGALVDDWKEQKLRRLAHLLETQ